jgi:predicted GNAT family N-acyltransferase
MAPEFECEVRTTLSPSQVDDLMRLYANEWWTRDRTRSDVERMLADSDLLVVVTERESQALVAFARVLTDRTYVALLLDTIVAPTCRGCGLGRLLVEHVCSAPELCNVERIELTCQPELIPFYRKWGFTENVGRSRPMRRSSNPVFSDAAAQQAPRTDGS